MKYFLVTSVFIVFTTFSLFAQQQQIDSLKSELAHSKTVKDSLDLLHQLHAAYLRYLPEKSLEVAQQTLSIAKRENLQKEQGQSLFNIGSSYYNLSSFKQSLNFYKKGFYLFKQLKDDKAIAKSYYYIGNVYANIGMRDSTLLNYQKALDLYGELQDEKESVNVLINIGNVLLNEQNYKEAIEYLIKGLSMAERANLTKRIGDANRLIGIINNGQGEYDSAMNRFTTALKYYQKAGDYLGISQTYTSIGNNYFYQKNKKEFLSNYDTAYYYAELSGNLSEIATVSGNLGGAYLKNEGYYSKKGLQLLEQSLEISREINHHRNITYALLNLGVQRNEITNYKEAVTFLTEAIEYGQMNDFRESIWKGQAELARSYAGLGDYENSYHLLNQSLNLMDTLLSYRQKRAIEETIAKYENDLLQKDIELKNATINRENTKRQSIIIISGILLFSIGVFAFLQNRKKIAEQRLNKELSQKNTLLTQAKEEIEQMKSELGHRTKNYFVRILSSMTEQAKRINNPDTLDAIEKAQSLIKATAIIHRMLETNQNQSYISISNYLSKFCKALEELYSEDQEKPLITLITEEVSVESNSAERLILIVNELVTNSVKHAFVNQSTPHIYITLKKVEQGWFRLIYRDNGSGLPANFDVNNSKSQGLRIINKLTRNIGGEISFENQDGAVFSFDFKNHDMIQE